ncbi:2-hydroxychromene-2-carboxylate isomerase [Neomegalonema sp.]|uniref:2-hydroxychromene-2-carboxylate isomerase n=1 Tax=Neomegalonema sp. TaxID=2039713 RepID=UPI00262A6F09|nr:DsbA family protein [Neomegalonema sp.]MDD2867386.1 DsbA family protein [Neomegalonema sp.]
MKAKPMAVIGYFFGLGSPWAYLGLDPLLELSARYGARLDPRPISLIEENGGIYSRNRPEVRRAYWFKDLRRWAELRGKTLKLEGRTGLSDPSPANFVVLAALARGEDWIAPTRILQKAFWEEGLDIGDARVRSGLLSAAGLDAEALEAEARGERVRKAWSENLDLARSAGVFGIPTHLLEGELYWGQDNLFFLERHLSRVAKAA